MPQSEAMGRVLSAVALVILLTATNAWPAQNSAPVQTLCILDFQRLGDDARSDWLEEGLADLMISTMSSVSPYLVIERKHLREILTEHGLAGSGLVDASTAVRRAQLAGAQLLLQGSFSRQVDQLTIQVRLIRVSDQQVLTQATWADRHSDVLSAPRALSEKLLRSLERSFGRESLVGIEHLIPTTIGQAKSYYQGLRAFDNGQYPEALAHYLDAASRAGDFRKAQPAVLEMYYLLSRSEHAVLFARDLARAYETKGDVPGAVEYYFAAAWECLGPLEDQRSARDLLQKLLLLVEQHERQTGEMLKTRRSILDRITELQRTGQHKDPEKLLTDGEIRHQVWLGDIEAELTRRAEEQARGGSAVLENGTWVKRPVPEPSVLMWKIRALGTLARAHAVLGEIGLALDQYQRLLREYEFLTIYLPRDGRLLNAIKTEAHFMMLKHYATSGRLIRDHGMNRINKLNLIANRQVFTRDFSNPSPDERARVASRYEGRGYEYFDFAAPAGYQIDSVTLRSIVEGIAEFGFDVPHPAGWPPQYSFSKRLTRLKFSRPGTYERVAVPPPGTEFLSLGTSWGPGLFSNTQAEVAHWKLNRPTNGQDVVRGELTFAVSPKKTQATTAKALEAKTPLDPAVRNVIDRYAAGWELASVVRDAQTAVYSGNPRLDVYAEDWLTFSFDGDIRIFHQREPQLEIGLPITVNSREREFDPSLVRTHNGQYALLWTRGTSKTNAKRFVAFSGDLLHWEQPQRLVFDEPPGALGYTYAQSEPLERTYNIVAVREGYAMLLAQGFVRHSADLRNWGAPRKLIPQDLDRNRLIRARDGTIWAVYENRSPELQPYTEDDWLHGFFVIDGKSYRHVTELRVSRSTDGIKWEDAGKVTLPGQPSGLWAFAIDERRMGIGLGFNNLSTKWFTVSSFGDLAQIDSQIPLMLQSGEAEFFVRGALLTCVRPVFDPERQKPMLPGHQH
ncbi:MAG: CsgG/HfaB family protein [Vicinamibacterales bacterium]